MKTIQDHIINNILPRDIKLCEHRELCTYNKYNLALADCRAKLPEILEYVYAELRKEVEAIQHYTGGSSVEPKDDRVNLHSVISLLSTNQK